MKDITNLSIICDIIKIYRPIFEEKLISFDLSALMIRLTYLSLYKFAANDSPIYLRLR